MRHSTRAPGCFGKRVSRRGVTLTVSFEPPSARRLADQRLLASTTGPSQSYHAADHSIDWWKPPVPATGSARSPLPRERPGTDSSLRTVKLRNGASEPSTPIVGGSPAQPIQPCSPGPTHPPQQRRAASSAGYTGPPCVGHSMTKSFVPCPIPSGTASAPARSASCAKWSCQSHTPVPSAACSAAPQPAGASIRTGRFAATAPHFQSTSPRQSVPPASPLRA